MTSPDSPSQEPSQEPSDEALRVMVAETLYYRDQETGLRERKDPKAKITRLNFQLPDYPNDLNAIAEAEKTLTEKEKLPYLGFLEQVVAHRSLDNTIIPMVCANAHQRAVAFLKTKGVL